MRFSFAASQQRAFSSSLDKTFKVYDLPSKTVLKTIQVQSPILKMEVDQIESFVYLACDNLNVYQFLIGGTESVKQRKTLCHKKRVTAMCLSVDGRFLITGDSQGSIYKWTLKDDSQSSTSLPLETFDIHKDRGAVTNLVAISRPLSLFGLTANMQGYEPGELRPLQKQLN